jgi:hypothetical protein
MGIMRVEAILAHRLQQCFYVIVAVPSQKNRKSPLLFEKVLVAS